MKRIILIGVTVGVVTVLLPILSGCWRNDVEKDVDHYLENFGDVQGTGSGSGSGTGSSSGPLSCSKMPTNFRCLEAAGAPAFTRYNYPSVVGSWHFSDIDMCITLNSGGSGSARIKNGNGSVAPSTLRWGVLVNSSGADVIPGTGTNHRFIVLDRDNGDYSQVALLTFDAGAVKFVGWTNRKASCPF